MLQSEHLHDWEKVEKKRWKRPRPYKRKVHIDNAEWSYAIKNCQILIRDPNCETSHRVGLSAFTGIDWHEIERICWKGPGIHIKPSDIKQYIESGLKAPVDFRL